jgi:hypothetical protein
VMAGEGPRHSHPSRVGGIVYAHGAPDHMFIHVLFYRYDRVTASIWIRYPEILLGEGLQLASIRLQIILWLRNANKGQEVESHGSIGDFEVQ